MAPELQKTRFTSCTNLPGSSFAEAHEKVKRIGQGPEAPMLFFFFNHLSSVFIVLHLQYSPSLTTLPHIFLFALEIYFNVKKSKSVKFVEENDCFVLSPKPCACSCLVKCWAYILTFKYLEATKEYFRIGSWELG